ncbi:MAG: hypothetical protein L0Y74_08090 [candidate division Zixibacteria bacterium]|nr:hypothetical protein [candidate division Zixibacteria bacterium]
MKIRIQDQKFNSTELPILIEFTQEEKDLIGKMTPEATIFFSYPPGQLSREDAEKMIANAKLIFGASVQINEAKPS